VRCRVHPSEGASGRCQSEERSVSSGFFIYRLGAVEMNGNDNASYKYPETGQKERARQRHSRQPLRNLPCPDPLNRKGA
jgi:hypothetical protein